MPRPSNTDERRRQIRRAFLRVMAREGYEGASIGKVASEARLAPGLVHYHFESKLEILLSILDRLAVRHRERLDEALEAAGPDVARRLDAFIDCHLATGARADPDALAVWVALGAEAIRRPEVRERYAAAVEETVAVLREIIRRGVAARRFRTDDGPVAAAVAIAAAIQGCFGLAAAAPGLIPRGSAAACVKRMAAGLLGVRPPPRTGRARR